MAPEKHLGNTVMCSSCCESFLHGKPLVKNLKILSQKNTEVVNFKNPDLHLIQSILLECGYFGFMISVFGFRQNNATSVSGFKNPFSDFTKQKTNFKIKLSAKKLSGADHSNLHNQKILRWL